jgi:hypothetical protein
MFTSSRTTAYSRSRRRLSASTPDPAVTMFWPSPESVASSASRFAGLSSTIKMFAFSAPAADVSVM